MLDANVRRHDASSDGVVVGPHLGRIHMVSFSPGVPVILTEMSVIPALAAGISLHFSATVYAQLDESGPASSAGQAATSAAMTGFLVGRWLMSRSRRESGGSLTGLEFGEFGE